MTRRCAVDECDHKYYAVGLCNMHYKRERSSGSPHITRAAGKLPDPNWVGEQHGYLLVRRNGKVCKQHRVIMEEILGHTLEPWENVHHINGVKNDNRPENLEIWVTRQPKGQRVEDLVEWAGEILARYGGK